MNGKYTGGGMIVDPFACMNDGLIDILIVTDENEMKFKRIVKVMDEAKKKGGIHAYGNHTFLRGKKIEITYKGRSGKNSNQQQRQLIGIDGEDCEFQKYVKYENIPQNIEILFDAENYFDEYKAFTKEGLNKNAPIIKKFIAKLFEQFDQNQDGYLDIEEFDEMC